MATPRRRPLELIVPSLVATTVFAFAAGSSSIARAMRIGHDARWALLVLLLVAAAARAWKAGFVIPKLGPTVAATALVALALVSAAWSVSPRLSVERGASLGLLFATALVLAAGERRPIALLGALVGGASAVAVAGLIVLAFDHAAAVQAASLESPARYRGFGQDANTAALLFALALPLTLGLLRVTRSPRARILLGSAAALFAGSIVASGSRGALFAAGIGALVVAVGGHAPSWRVAGVAAVVVATVAIGLVVQNVPKAPTRAHTPAVAHSPLPTPSPGYLDAEAVYPLSADVGAPLPGGGQPSVTRGFFGGSGRLDAWTGTLHQILQRPLLGFGFGTEGDVFVDRYYYFVGGSPENSYLGISLQLGAIGLVALLGLFASVLVPLRRTLLRPGRELTVACAGVVAAGLVLALVQSYVYSAGDIGSATLWICAFLLPMLHAESRDV